MRTGVLTALLSCLLYSAAATAAVEAEPTGQAPMTASVAEEDSPADAAGPAFFTPVQADRSSGEDLYGARIGYVHPFLSLGGYHTDNLYRTASEEKSDWVTVITPGLWVAVPAGRQQLLDIELLNAAPGGMALDRFRTPAERRLQGYALYRADIFEHDRYTEENRVEHRGEGLLRLSLRGGLELELFDIYRASYDPYGSGGSADRDLDKYRANLGKFSIGYRFTPKLSIRGEIGRYTLDYADDRNDYLDRSDDSLAAYLYYQATPKTAIFLQLGRDSIDYDDALNDDSDNYSYYLGAEYRISTKTRAMLKVGYGDKRYDRDDSHDRDDLLAEGQLDYSPTPKSSFHLSGTRRVLETDQLGGRNILSTRLQAAWRHRILAKVKSEATAFYINNRYDGTTTIGTQSEERDDDEYGVVVALGYAPMRWATFSLGYEYRQRDSNFDSEDFTDNTVFVRITAAM